MLKILTRRTYSLAKNLGNDSIKRYFLSNAYQCTEAWENRLKHPVFGKISLDNMYHELDLNLSSNKRVNVVDIDLFMTALTDVSYKNELEDVLLRLRCCPECVLLPERASHAAIRFFIEHTKKEDLLNILSDRLNFGLFPDYYLNNIMMDKFLKDKDAVSAVKIAALLMLQEDFDHPITKILALYCCYYYLSSSDVWESYKEPEPDPDEEVIPVRVKYLRNLYFDDHFDLKDTNHFVGKTLWLTGHGLPEAIGVSSQLIGLVLYEKFDKCAVLLDKVLQSKEKIYEEAVMKAREYTMKKPKQTEHVKSEEGEEKEIKSEEGEEKEIKSEEKPLDSDKVKVLELLEKLDKGKLIKGSLLEECEKLLKKEVEANEKKDIELQCQLYQQWEVDRESDIQKEIHRAEVEKTQEEIEKVKQELAEKEEKIFFFDKEEELLLNAQKNEEKIKRIRYYKGKYEKNLEEEYVPPIVTPQKNN